jgi:hypothetical protein
VELWSRTHTGRSRVGSGTRNITHRARSRVGGGTRNKKTQRKKKGGEWN